MRSSFARLGAATFVLALGFFSALHTFSSAHTVDYTVTTTDSGRGSLRQALVDANGSPGHDTITFAVIGTIALDSPLPDINDDVTLQGPGSGELAVSTARPAAPSEAAGSCSCCACACTIISTYIYPNRQLTMVAKLSSRMTLQDFGPSSGSKHRFMAFKSLNNSER